MITSTRSLADQRASVSLEDFIDCGAIIYDRWPTHALGWLEWGTAFLAKRFYDFNIRNYLQFVEKPRIFIEIR
jgi:hypothetical protein